MDLLKNKKMAIQELPVAKISRPSIMGFKLQAKRKALQKLALQLKKNCNLLQSMDPKELKNPNEDIPRSAPRRAKKQTTNPEFLSCKSKDIHEIPGRERSESQKQYLLQIPRGRHFSNVKDRNEENKREMLSKLTEQSIYLVREEISRANKIGDEKLSQSSIFGGAGNESKFNKNKCVSRRAESVVSAITDEKGGRTGTSTRQSKYNAEYTDKGGNGNQGGKVDEEVNVSKYIQNDMTIEEEIRKELGDLNGRDKRRLLDNQRKYGPGLKHDSSTQSEYKLTADREEEKYLEQPIVKVNQTTLHLEKQIKKKRRKVNARVGGVFQFQGSWEKENNIEKKVIKYPEMRGGRYENELFPEGDIMRNVRIDTRIAESRPHVEKHQRALTSSSIPRSFGFLESEDISKYYPDPNNWIKRASKERGESNLLIWKDKLSEMRDNLRGLEADYNSLRGIKVDCIGSGNEGDIKSPRGQRTKTEYGNHPQTKYNGGFKPSFLDYEIHSKFTLNPNKPKNSLNRLVLRGKMGARTQIHTGGLYAEMGMGVTHMGGRLGGPGGPGRPGGPGEMGSFSFMSNSTNYGGDHSRQFSDGAWVKRRIYTKHVPSTAPGRHTRTVSQKPNITAIHSPNITPMF